MQFKASSMVLKTHFQPSSHLYSRGLGKAADSTKQEESNVQACVVCRIANGWLQSGYNMVAMPFVMEESEMNATKEREKKKRPTIVGLFS